MGHNRAERRVKGEQEKSRKKKNPKQPKTEHEEIRERQTIIKENQNKEK